MKSVSSVRSGRKLLTHQPVHIVVKVLGADTSMPMIQYGCHGSIAVIWGVEMLGSAPPRTRGSAKNAFSVTLEASFTLSDLVTVGWCCLDWVVERLP